MARYMATVRTRCATAFGIRTTSARAFAFQTQSVKAYVYQTQTRSVKAFAFVALPIPSCMSVHMPALPTRYGRTYTY
jgi:hypothetical protein